MLSPGRFWVVLPHPRASAFAWWTPLIHIKGVLLSCSLFHADATCVGENHGANNHFLLFGAAKHGSRKRKLPMLCVRVRLTIWRSLILSIASELSPTRSNTIVAWSSVSASLALTRTSAKAALSHPNRLQRGSQDELAYVGSSF